MNQTDWEKLCRSQLKAVQILTNEIDKVNTENQRLHEELNVSNNSIKTLLNEQEQLHDRIAQLMAFIKETTPYEPIKEVKVIQEELPLDNKENTLYLEKPKRKFQCPNGHPKLRHLTNEQVNKIRQYHLNGHTKSQISHFLNIKHGIVNAILDGRTYRNVK